MSSIKRCVLFGMVCMMLTSKASAADKLTIAYQHGIAYAPLMIMQEKKMIESMYDGDITVEWLVLNSGAAINEGFVAGAIDVAGMGIAPFITGATVGIGYKMFATISSQPHALMTHREDIRSLADIGSDTKIALVNIGSIQHILLAMSAKRVLGDAHALDRNIVTMSHPDGMTSLIAGAVDCQLTTAPYIQVAQNNSKIHLIPGLEDVWPQGRAFIVGVVSEHVAKNEKMLSALRVALDAADAFIANDKYAAAAILASKLNAAAGDVAEWLSDPACIYDVDLDGVQEMAAFMGDNGFLDYGAPPVEKMIVVR